MCLTYLTMHQVPTRCRCATLPMRGMGGLPAQVGTSREDDPKLQDAPAVPCSAHKSQ
jgi:hypothetical protein